METNNLVLDPTRYDTNLPVQSQKQPRNLKFQNKKKGIVLSV